MSFLSNETDSLLNNDTVLSTTNSSSRYYEERSGASTLGTIILIVNATLGAGLLNFPEAFDRAGGIAVSIIIQLCFLVFITVALIILAKCSDLTDSSSMQDAFAKLCGHRYLFFCGICVVVYSFGCCITFLIIIGDQFDRVLATYYGMDFCNHWYLSRAFITSTLSAVFILPLCFFKSLDVLSYASLIGCLNILYVVWVIIYESFKSTSLLEHPVKMWPENAIEALQIIPVICFAYQSHMSAIPTYICMKNRNLCGFSFCAITSMILCFLVYSLAGIFGYMTFGIGKVPSDILQGYKDKSMSLCIAMVAVAIKIFTTYPIVLYCGRDAFLGIFGIDSHSNIKIKVFVTLLWFVLTMITAILVPDISPIINLLGSLSATFIFVIPGICFMQSVLQKDEKLVLNKNQFYVFIACFMVTLGMFICGIVFVEAVQDLQKPEIELKKVTGLRVGLTRSLCN